MARQHLVMATLLCIGAAACGNAAEKAADSEDRDLTLPAVEPIAAIADEPEPDAKPVPPAPPAERPRARRPAPKPEPPAPKPEPVPEPVIPTLAAGTTFTIVARDTLTSRHNATGEEVAARTVEAVRDESGMVVIPAGAVFYGTISDIAPAESPGGEGRLALAFDRVEIAEQTYALQARVDSVGTRMKGRGVTAGDAAKVGAGAVVGAIAGRVIGGNKAGTIVGAAAGTAAGVGIAAATRDVDIILDAGAPIRLVLTAPLALRDRE
jgi:hypothetical protein